jgi:hypothetical protein
MSIQRFEDNAIAPMKKKQTEKPLLVYNSSEFIRYEKLSKNPTKTHSELTIWIMV